MTSKPTAHWFKGFDPAKQAEYQKEARERWGDQAVDEANERVRDKPEEWWSAEGQKWVAVVDRMVGLLDAGKAPSDPEVLDVVAEHYRWVSQFWTPNREAYTCLGQMYVDDPRFKANYDRTDPRLAEYLRDAMAAYAAARLESSDSKGAH